MKIQLVFNDWKKDNKSVYGSNYELTYGDFHAGTCFKADIELDEHDAEELQAALKNGFVPVFEVYEQK